VTRGHEEGDGYTSEDRNLLRAVAGHGEPTVNDIARMTGVSRQRARRLTSMLAHCGLLAYTRGTPGTYAVTAAGRAELDAHPVRMFLVEVDDRVAEQVAMAVAQAYGVRDVTDHGDGCCCQHCPHGGNCR
jgi:DNA-binding IclR family transcriptional regulator